MGTYQHDAILVTGYEANIIEAFNHAQSMFPPFLISELSSPVGVMLYQTFCIWPDGSKEDFIRSDGMNSLRAQFITWLALSRCTYTHVSYGELGEYASKTSYKSPNKRW